MDALRAHFRPEFLNRVDEIIIFDRLSEEELKKIVEIQLGRLSKRLEQQKITLKLSDSAKALLAREGYDPVLRRATLAPCHSTRDSRSAQHRYSRRQSPRGPDRFTWTPKTAHLNFAKNSSHYSSL
jgi:hypothetical protein